MLSFSHFRAVEIPALRPTQRQNKEKKQNAEAVGQKFTFYLTLYKA
jgi:hypothetical protein